MRVSLLSVLLLAAAPVFAADVDGDWAGSMATPNGDIPVSFTFMADGTMLNGSTSGPDGNAVAISDGMVDGDTISFSVTFDFNGMPFTMNYKGVVAGEQIKFTIDIFGMPVELTVKKAT